MRRTVLIVAALFLAGCGEKTIIASGAEDTIENFVSQNTQATARDVRCPRDEPAEVGHTFDCTFEGPEGPYVAHMEVLNVEGERVEFKIVTERAPQ